MTIDTDAKKCACVLAEAATNTGRDGLLSKGAELLELSTRIDAATILSLADAELKGVGELGSMVIEVISALLKTLGEAANYQKMAHRLVCVSTVAARAVIVLHRATDEKRDLVKAIKAVATSWLGNIGSARTHMRSWNHSKDGHAHVQLLLGLQLTIIESGLRSLPDPDLKNNAAVATGMLVVGVAKSAMMMKVDAAVFTGLTNLVKMAAESGGRYLASSCFNELYCVEEARALAHIGVQDGSDVEIRQMMLNMYSRLDDDEKPCVRWELLASFATMLADILVSKGALTVLSTETIRFVCLGDASEQVTGERVQGTGKKASKAAGKALAWPGLVGMLSIGERKNERADPTAIGIALLAVRCTRRVEECARPYCILLSATVCVLV